MTNREQLVKELAQAPDALVEELMDFYLFIKQRRNLVTPPGTSTAQSGLRRGFRAIEKAHGCGPLNLTDRSNPYFLRAGTQFTSMRNSS
jgi:hypothetical protein